MPYTAGSLFSGIGLIDYAFAKAGFDIRFQVEIEPFCQKILTKHAPEYWPNARIFHDIKTVRAGDLGAVDVLFGGFPCTDLSNAGRRAGIKEGTRSGLWFEFARLIGDLRPRYVFIENVPPITTNGGTTVIGNLAAMGYDAQWGIVAASDVGAPHRRERWFCVAHTQRPEWRQARVEEREVDHDDNRVPGWQETAGGAGVGDPTVEDTSIEGFSPKRVERTPWSPDSDIVIPSGELGHSQRGGLDRQSRRRTWQKPSNGHGEPGQRGVGQADAHAARLPLARTEVETSAAHGGTSTATFGSSGRTVKSRLGGIFDELPSRLDAIRRQSRWPARPGEAQHLWEPPRTARGIPNRIARLKALGNAVVWQVIFPFAQGIWEALVAEDTGN